MIEGEYEAEIVHCTGSMSNHNYGDPAAFRRQVQQQAMVELTAHLNTMKSEGWLIVDIKKPDIAINEPMLGLSEYSYTSQTFVLWQRKPLAQAIYGD